MPREEDPFAEVSDAPNRRLPDLLLPEDRVQPEPWRLTPERGVYLSVILHLLLVLAIILIPPPKVKPKKLEDMPDPLGLIALMSAPKPEPPIPVQFFPAPGPAAKAPGKNPLPSDLNRQAHGGDPKLPKAAQPKAVPLPGIRDLDPGKRGERERVAAAPERSPAQAGEPDGSPPKTAESLLALTRPKGEDGTESRPKALRGLPASALTGLTAEEAARAAKSLGQGDDGGGYEHEGGFADSGPLSFDTFEYDWGSYAAAMIRKIKQNWDVPTLAQYGIKGRVTIRFFILKDGHVDGERILSSSGIPPFDNAAFQSIAHASPFRALPADLGHDREGVTVTFFYNIRPEDSRASGSEPKRPSKGK